MGGGEEGAEEAECAEGAEGLRGKGADGEVQEEEARADKLPMSVEGALEGATCGFLRKSSRMAVRV